MVKEYRRPAPGKVMSEPCELRPADVLIKTVHYLFHKWVRINIVLSFLLAAVAYL